MMKDDRQHLEALRQQTAESAFISALAPPQKRAMFRRPFEHVGG